MYQGIDCSRWDIGARECAPQCKRKCWSVSDKQHQQRTQGSAGRVAEREIIIVTIIIIIIIIIIIMIITVVIIIIIVIVTIIIIITIIIVIVRSNRARPSRLASLAGARSFASWIHQGPAWNTGQRQRQCYRF